MGGKLGVRTRNKWRRKRSETERNGNWFYLKGSEMNPGFTHTHTHTHTLYQILEQLDKNKFAEHWNRVIPAVTEQSVCVRVCV